MVIGSVAGQANALFGNVFIGYSAAKNNTGNYSVAIGQGAMVAAGSGGSNVMIGHSAGQNTTGGGNVFLGYRAGQNETGSNKLYIDNSNTANPLIYGEFNNNLVKINGTLQIGNGSPTAAAGILRYSIGIFYGHNGSAWKELAYTITTGNSVFLGGSNSILGTTANTFIGQDAGASNQAGGQDNTFIGTLAGNGNTSGSYNVMIGTYAGNVIPQVMRMYL